MTESSDSLTVAANNTAGNNNKSTSLHPLVTATRRVRSRKSTGHRKSSRVSAPRLRELESQYVAPIFEKTPEDEAIIRTELLRNFIFKKKAPNAIENLVNAFEVIPVGSYKKGDVIIEQYDDGDYFYILGKTGKILFEDEENDNDDNDVVVGSSDIPGTSFGELALLYETPRKVTVRVDSDDIELYRVDQLTFRYILMSRSKFKALGMQAVAKVKATNRLLSFVGKTAAMKQFMNDDNDDDTTDDEEDLGATPSDIKNLDAADGYDDDDKEKAKTCYDTYMGELEKHRSFIRTSMEMTKQLSVKNFKRNSVLGAGAYGEVWLVQPNNIEDIMDREQKFALKIQSKDNMEREKQFEYSVEEAIKRECKVLKQLCHPMIVHLVHNFEDTSNIYMVLGVIQGMELWDCIHRQDTETGDWISGFPEEDAKFYAILMADTLTYMHHRQVCHRDIKPENVMVDHNGYPILIDFGFAKTLPDDKTYTLCGTPKYTAPEIIENEGHGCAIDFWSLGVVIFEMLSGENPFWYEDISDLQLLDDICNAEPFPIQDDIEVSEEAMDILSKLLVKDPKQRLLCDDVTSHPWFDSIDLEKARTMTLPAPWTPPEKKEEQQPE